MKQLNGVYEKYLTLDHLAPSRRRFQPDSFPFRYFDNSRQYIQLQNLFNKITHETEADKQGRSAQVKTSAVYCAHQAVSR